MNDITLGNHDNLACCRRVVRDQCKAVDSYPVKDSLTATEHRQIIEEDKPKKTSRTRSQTRNAVTEEAMESDGESVITACSFRTRVSVNSRYKSDSVRMAKIGGKNIEGIKKLSELKSGFLDKPMSQVVVKHKWPHMNQNPRYITEALTFHQLSFPQFVRGECRTIMKTDNMNELYGRLRILSKVAYLYDQCKSWDRARSVYFAIISSIEEGEAGWNGSFGHYDLMCVPPLEQKSEKSDQKPPIVRPKQPQKRDYFCKEFQKGECMLTAPHKAWIRNTYESVDHFCMQCMRAKLGKLNHIPGSEQCGNPR